jgi:phage protein D
MAVGQVSFHSDKRVKRGMLEHGVSCGFTHDMTVYIAKRDNAIVNRLNKTKIEKEINHEQEQVDRLKKENAVKRAAAAAKASPVAVAPSLLTARAHIVRQAKAERELAEQRMAEKSSRSYDLLDTPHDEWEEGGQATKPSYSSVREMEEDFM